MAKNQITKEEIKKLMEIPGKVRGVVFKTDFEYVKEKLGNEGLTLLKEKIKEWGVSLDYEKIKITEWYPVWLRIISLLVIKEAFSWDDKKIEDLGNCAPKYSFVVATLMRHFLSLEKSIKETPKYWEKHYTVGEIEPGPINEKEKLVVIRLKNFKLHPILCVFFKGYFLRISQYIIKSRKITIEETKCMFKGDPYHEYLVRWK